jgi:phosphoribosylaminoimidazolecarboxamide formyltransferase/IMP cyclohydrolase
MREMQLRYGMNPHQRPARVTIEGRDLPFEVLGGTPGYINLLDALNSWQLVKELSQATGRPAAASFKHVSPAGAAVAKPVPEQLKRACFLEDNELSDLASAYVRARSSDRMSSFGDWAALSETVDVSTARVLRREVSDGVIAPEYEDDALEILKKKKNGGYRILRIDSDFVADVEETREVFGIALHQKRNNAAIDRGLLKNVVTKIKDIPDEAAVDLLVALVTLKYTQSNSICLAYDSQTIGVGAGQQSRIHCTQLAISKAQVWWLRQHPRVLSLPFREGLKRPEKDNAVVQYLSEELTDQERALWDLVFTEPPKQLNRDEKKEWLEKVQGVSIASDAFFPFRDNIDKANQLGVRYVAQPGGSLRDDAVIEACNEYGMAMAFTGLRLFHH